MNDKKENIILIYRLLLFVIISIMLLIKFFCKKTFFDIIAICEFVEAGYYFYLYKVKKEKLNLIMFISSVVIFISVFILFLGTIV